MTEMAHKSFQTYQPTEGSTFDINGKTFHLVPSVPGDLLLDFLAGTEGENVAAMADSVRNLMLAAIVPEQHEEWKTFIRTPSNNVTLNTLSEIAGFVAERLSGNPTQPQPTPFTAG